MLTLFPPPSTSPPPHAAMPLPPGPGGGPLDGLYAAKDLGPGGGGEGFLGSLRLRFKRLHPLERAATWQRAQVSPGLLTCYIPFSKYTQHLSPEAWQAMHHSPP